MWSALVAGILVILYAFSNILLYVHDRKNKRTLVNLVVGVLTIIIVLALFSYAFYIHALK